MCLVQKVRSLRMLRSHLAVVGLAASVTYALSLAACGGAENEGKGGGAGGKADSVGLPPPPGPIGHPGDGSGVVLAISKLYLGDTDRQGKKSTSAWKGFGFNLDGKVSTAQSTDLCKPRAGGKASTSYPDGEHGIDNSFGKNIL